MIQGIWYKLKLYGKYLNNGVYLNDRPTCYMV